MERAGEVGHATATLLLQISMQLAQNSSDPLITSLPQGSPLSSMTVAINVLWSISLGLSLVAAVYCILVKQWLRMYMRWTEVTPMKQAIALRQLRYEGLQRWRMPWFIALLPMLLHASLVIFFIGLSLSLIQLNALVANITIGCVGSLLFIAIILVITPLFARDSPFKTRFFEALLFCAESAQFPLRLRQMKQMTVMLDRFRGSATFDKQWVDTEAPQLVEKLNEYHSHIRTIHHEKPSEIWKYADNQRVLKTDIQSVGGRELALRAIDHLFVRSNQQTSLRLIPCLWSYPRHLRQDDPWVYRPVHHYWPAVALFAGLDTDYDRLTTSLSLVNNPDWMSATTQITLNNLWKWRRRTDTSLPAAANIENLGFALLASTVVDFSHLHQSLRQEMILAQGSGPQMTERRLQAIVTFMVMPLILAIPKNCRTLATYMHMIGQYALVSRIGRHEPLAHSDTTPYLINFMRDVLSATALALEDVSLSPAWAISDVEDWASKATGLMLATPKDDPRRSWLPAFLNIALPLMIDHRADMDERNKSGVEERALACKFRGLMQALETLSAETLANMTSNGYSMPFMPSDRAWNAIYILAQRSRSRFPPSFACCIHAQAIFEVSMGAEGRNRGPLQVEESEHKEWDIIMQYITMKRIAPASKLPSLTLSAFIGPGYASAAPSEEIARNYI